MRNTGTTGVTLDRALTRLELVRPGGGSLATGLSAVTAVAGGDTATLSFDSLTVAASDPRGMYAARLVLAGTESGQAFADTVALDPDSVAVLDPAILSVTSIAPDTVSAGQSRPVTLAVSNTGDVAFQAGGQTTLRFGSPVSATLSISGAATIAPGGFLGPRLLGSAARLSAGPGHGLSDPRGARSRGRPRARRVGRGRRARGRGAGSASLRCRLDESGHRARGRDPRPHAHARERRRLASPRRSRGVAPSSGADGVESAVALGSGAPFTLAPGTIAILSFPGTAFPLALASQPYPVTLVVAGSAWGLADSASVRRPRARSWSPSRPPRCRCGSRRQRARPGGPRRAGRTALRPGADAARRGIGRRRLGAPHHAPAPRAHGRERGESPRRSRSPRSCFATCPGRSSRRPRPATRTRW